MLDSETTSLNCSLSPFSAPTRNPILFLKQHHGFLPGKPPQDVDRKQINFSARHSFFMLYFSYICSFLILGNLKKPGCQ